VAREKTVPAFYPRLTSQLTLTDNKKTGEFLREKLVQAELCAYKAPSFTRLSMRTKSKVMMDIVKMLGVETPPEDDDKPMKASHFSMRLTMLHSRVWKVDGRIKGETAMQSRPMHVAINDSHVVLYEQSGTVTINASVKNLSTVENDGRALKMHFDNSTSCTIKPDDEETLNEIYEFVSKVWKEKRVALKRISPPRESGTFRLMGKVRTSLPDGIMSLISNRTSDTEVSVEDLRLQLEKAVMLGELRETKNDYMMRKVDETVKSNAKLAARIVLLEEEKANWEQERSRLVEEVARLKALSRA